MYKLDSGEGGRGKWKGEGVVVRRGLSPVGELHGCVVERVNTMD